MGRGTSAVAHYSALEKFVVIKKLAKSLSAVIVLLPLSGNAALIDSGTFFTDTAAGLDWLDITATTNRSYNDVSSEFGVGGEFEGWRFATQLEFDALLLGQGWTAMTCGGDVFCGWSTANNGLAAPLVSLFGDAYELNASGSDTAGYVGGLKGMLLDTVPGCAGSCSFQVVAELRDQGFQNPDDLANSPTADWAASQSETVGRNSTAAGRGSFLVRATVVPVPAAAWLFASGLSLLIGMRMRKPYD